MKRRHFVLILIAMLSAAAGITALADDSANIYSYLLNDYITTYGAYSTENAGDAVEDDVPVSVEGVVYADLCDFDFSGDDYLVIYLVSSEENTAACHIWRYDDDKKTAERTAVISKPFSVGRYETGVFSQGTYNGRTVIEYSRYSGEKRTSRELYTNVDSEPVMYVGDIEQELTGIMDYNICRFHAGVDVSGWNAQLTDFFDRLKDSSADSVSYKSSTEQLSDDEVRALYSELSSRIPAGGAVYTQESECELDTDARVMGISARCELGGGYEYVLFATDKAQYNWALVSHNGTSFTVIRAKADAIPLSDSEIERVMTEFGVSAPTEAPSEAPAEETVSVKKNDYTLTIAAVAAFLVLALTFVCLLVMLI